jgi:malate permease and related proteins
MILVALAVVLSTAFGVVCEHRRSDTAARASRLALEMMLYALVPFVSFVNIAHLHLTSGGGVGLIGAYVAFATAGLIAWAIGRFGMRLPRPTLGAVILTVVIVNTGYLGLPMTVALLGASHLGSAIAYDQLVSGPMLLTVGFGIGAAFGSRAGDTGRARLRAFLVRNPPLIAVIAGLIAPASLAPASLVTASHVAVVALLPLGFFGVGVNLSAERREDAAPLLELPDRRVVLAVVMRLAAVPLVLALISAAIIKVPSAYLLQAAMPTGINSLIVGHAYGLDQRLIATIIVWSTLTVLIVGLGISLL